MLSMKERGFLGAKAKYEKYKIREANIKIYNQSPKKCVNCLVKLSYNQRKQKFCSKSCANSYNNKQKSVDIFCLICKKKVTSKKSKYCSKTCSRYSFKLRTIENFNNSSLKDPSSVRNALKLCKPYKCENCRIRTWKGKELTLQVDHIDGNYLNNSIENLRFLCPNCHSQTENFGIKNKGNGRYKRRLRYAEGKSN